MHCSLGCGNVKLKRDKRTRLFVYPRHGFVGPRARLRAFERNITEEQWSSIHKLGLKMPEHYEFLDRLLTAFYRSLNNALARQQ